MEEDFRHSSEGGFECKVGGCDEVVRFVRVEVTGFSPLGRSLMP